MPTYYARGISVHLGIAPLVSTTTPAIVLKKGDVARQQCENAEQQLLQSTPLREERISFPGDERGFGVNWLGNAPFMQTHISARNNNFTGKASDSKPTALSLHIKLSDKAFNSGLRGSKTNLKIDIFFNGKLASCSFIPIHDVRSGVKSLHQIFAGTRIDYLAERPWTVSLHEAAAGETDAEDSPRSACQRWQQICNQVRAEVDERGKDEHDRMPPSAEFLSALANLGMPTEVADMQRKGGKQFGVIDFVISAGEGMKTTRGTSYLKAPTRLRNDKFRRVTTNAKLNEVRSSRTDSQGNRGETERYGKDEDFASGSLQSMEDVKLENIGVVGRYLQMPVLPHALSCSTTTQNQESPTRFSNLTFPATKLESSPALVSLSPSRLESEMSGLHDACSEAFKPAPPTSCATYADENRSLTNCASVSSLVPATPELASSALLEGGLSSPSQASTLFGLQQQYLGHFFPTSHRSPHCPSLVSLPPTGLFTVPTKPKSGKIPSPTKPANGTKSMDICDLSATAKPTISICPTAQRNADHPSLNHEINPLQGEYAEDGVRIAVVLPRTNSPTRSEKLSQMTPPAADAMLTSATSYSSPLSSVPPSSSSSSVPSSVFRIATAARSSCTHDYKDLTPATNSSSETSSQNQSRPSVSPVHSALSQLKGQQRWQLSSPNTPGGPSDSPLMSQASDSPISSLHFRKPSANSSNVTEKQTSARNCKHSRLKSSPMSSAPFRRTKKKHKPLRGALGSESSHINRYVFDNPPLNEHCVIGYAGREQDGEADKPVLRQVKGERQGVFEEDYVVFAGRYYVHCGRPREERRDE